MPGDLGATIEHDEFRSPQRHPNLTADQASRDRVFRLPHRNQSRPTHPRVKNQARIEPLLRDGRESQLLDGEVLGDRVNTLVHPTGVVGLIPGPEPLVQLGQRSSLRHRRQTVAAEPADLALDLGLVVIDAKSSPKPGV